MKLANLTYPLNPDDVNHFKMMNKYGMVEVSVQTRIPNIVEMIQRCINKLKVQGCLEFAFHDIKYKYHIMEDEHEWTISLIGFMRLN